MIRIMFVCHGNICRSPMAEFIFRDMVKKAGIADRFVIESSATSTEEIWNGIGNPVYPPAKRELAKHGIGCDGKRAVQLKKSDYDKYDYFICMDSNNIRNTMRIFGDDKDGKVCKMMSFATPLKRLIKYSETRLSFAFIFLMRFFIMILCFASFEHSHRISKSKS